MMLAALVALVGAAATMASSDAGRPPSSMTQSKVDELLAVVLDRTLTVPDYLPSRSYLPKDGPIRVLRSVGNGEFSVTDQALKDPSRWVIRSEEELAAEADATGKNVYFVIVVDVTITGTSGIVQAGVTLAAPKVRHAAIMCCCFGYDRYERSKAGVWLFRGRDKTGCW